MKNGQIFNKLGIFTKIKFPDVFAIALDRFRVCLSVSYSLQ